MKKSVFLTFFAVGLLALTSCGSEELGTDVSKSDTPVSFGTYVGRTTQTRGSDQTLAGSVQQNGIKVFAFYTGDKDFKSAGIFTTSADGTTYNESQAPNFMNKQSVEWSNSSWTYSPVKYWPNNGEKLSFFAIAGDLKKDSEELGFGDALKYEYTCDSDPAKSYDLLYAEPVLDKTKQNIDGKVTFTFKHAMAKIKLQAAYTVDATNQSDDGTTLDASTSIKITEVTLGSTTTGFDNKAVWNLFGGITDVLSGAMHWKPSGGATAQAMTWDSDDFVSDFALSQNYQDLSQASSSAFVIPQDFTSTALPITIKYSVTTTDSNNSANSSTINNTISSTISVNFEAGKSYTIRILIGMTSVKFDVNKVDDWTDATDIDVDLPANTDTNT